MKHFKDKVPGATILTDIWLYLHRKCDNVLLTRPDIPVETQAAEEAGRCKRLMGALRYLYRNSDFAAKRNRVESALQCVFCMFPMAVSTHGHSQES